MSKDSIEIIIQTPSVARDRMRYVWELVQRGLAGGPVHLTLGREKRTLSQNRKLWPTLTDISRQVEWYGEMLTPEEWKHMLTAALYKQKTVPGIDGGFVVMGISTSTMRKKEFAELIEFIQAFGAEKGVKWSEKSECLITEYTGWLESQRNKGE